MVMQTVRQGQSLPFAFDLDGDDITGYVCTIEAKQFPADAASVSRVIQPTNSEWVGLLTSTETAALTSLGEWALIAKITNASTDAEVVKTKRFHLAEAL